MMRWEAAAERVLANLERAGWVTAEVFVKRGRSRRYTLRQEMMTAGQAVELGHAVRAGNARGSFFRAANGRPTAPKEWPAGGPGRLLLPAPSTGARWKRTEDLPTPLATEGEAGALLGRLDEQLAASLSGARLVSAIVEDGVSEAEVVNSRGVRCQSTRRAAALHVEGVAPLPGGSAVRRLYLAERAVRQFDPDFIAARLAERLLLAGGVDLDRSQSAPCLLAPEVAAVLLAGCSRRLVGTAAWERSREHRWGRAPLTIVDDPHSPQSLIGTAWDGEGVPTERVTLVEQGRFRRPLLAWWQAEDGESVGCTQRPGWRDLPFVGPSQLLIEAVAGVRSGDLLESISEGFYWREALTRGVFDSASDRFALPVAGYSVARGRDRVPIRSAMISGSLTGLFEAIDGIGEDLRYVPMQGLFGSPSLRISGLATDPLGS